MGNRATVFYAIMLFLYVLAIPFYGSYIIPMVKTIVFVPFIFIIFLDKSKRYLPLFKLGVVQGFGCFILFGLITYIFVQNREIALEQLTDYIVDVAFLMIFIIMASSSNRMLKPIIYALIIGFGISLLLGIYQHYSGSDTFKIQSDEATNQNLIEGTGADQISRAGGPFGNSLTFSMYLSVVGLILAIGFLAQKSKKFMFLSMVVCAFTFIGLVFSGGRTALAIFSLSYLFAFSKIIKSKFIVFACFAITAGILFFYSADVSKIPIISRFVKSDKDFKNGRLDNWEYAIKIIEISPFIGSGIGNLNTTLTDLKDPNILPSAKLSHNGHLESVFITVLATYGILGLLVFLGWIIAITVKSQKVLALLRNTKYYGYMLACLYGWIVFLINCITDPAIIFDFRMMFLFLILASSPYFIAGYFKKITLKIPNNDNNFHFNSHS